MKPILETCCGLDVHRDQVTACIASGPLDRAKEKLIVKEFSTMTYGLRELSSWLKEHNVKTVAMESTGVFWKPIFNILEDDFEVLLANAARIKNVPVSKTQTFHKSFSSSRCGHKRMRTRVRFSTLS